MRVCPSREDSPRSFQKQPNSGEAVLPDSVNFVCRFYIPVSRPSAAGCGSLPEWKCANEKTILLKPLCAAFLRATRFGPEG